MAGLESRVVVVGAGTACGGRRPQRAATAGTELYSAAWARRVPRARWAHTARRASRT